MLLNLGEKEFFYEPGYIPNFNPALSLKVREDFLSSFFINESEVEETAKNYGFEVFSGINSDYFGYNGSFSKVGERNGVVEFSIALPKAKAANIPSWKPIHAVVQSISLFTELARRSYTKEFKRAPSGRKQLMSLYVVADYKRDLRAIGGDLFPSLCWWINNRATKQNFDNVVRAMEQTHYHLTGMRSGESFLVYSHEGGGLTLGCPHHCVIYPRGIPDKRGVEFDSSEIMNDVEILTAISGLFALYPEAGRDLYGSSF